jgi:hypothetical protein
VVTPILEGLDLCHLHQHAHAGAPLTPRSSQKTPFCRVGSRAPRGQDSPGSDRPCQTQRNNWWRTVGPLSHENSPCSTASSSRHRRGWRRTSWSIGARAPPLTHRLGYGFGFGSTNVTIGQADAERPGARARWNAFKSVTTQSSSRREDSGGPGVTHVGIGTIAAANAVLTQSISTLTPHTDAQPPRSASPTRGLHSRFRISPRPPLSPVRPHGEHLMTPITGRHGRQQARVPFDSQD